jgi:hypothetical protein
MASFSFSKFYPDGLRVFIFIGDFFVCAFSFILAGYLYHFAGPWIGKSPIAFDAIQYFKDHALVLIVSYPLLNYMTSSLKFALNFSRDLGGVSLGFTTLLYLVWITFWLKTRGFPLKTFFALSFFVFFVVGFVWRFFVLKGLRRLFFNIHWEDKLPPFFLKYLRRLSAYFREKPSAVFMIAFIILLICCAFLLEFDQTLVAEKLANGAFFSLLLGVFIEFIQIARNHGRDSED